TGSPGAPAGTGRLPRSDPMPEGVLSGSGNRIGTARSADCTILGTGVHRVNASAFLRPGCGRILTRPGPPASPDAPRRDASRAGRPEGGTTSRVVHIVDPQYWSYCGKLRSEEHTSELQARFELV